MTGLECDAQGCTGIVSTAGGMCEAHRRALTLTAKFQDATYEFLHKQVGSNLQSSITLTPETMHKVQRAGMHLAQSMALLISASFDTDNIEYETEPIKLRSLSAGATSNWRVGLKWNATGPNVFEDWSDTDSNDELDDDEEDEP